jgi:tetratricopeptide (TPR) repeat protein
MKLLRLSFPLAILCLALTAPLVLADDAAKAEAPAKAGDKALAKADDKAPARTEAPSIIESALIDITREQNRIFSAMEAGELTQEDFERKVVALSFHYDEMIARDPNNLTTLVLYGKFLRRIGKNDQANLMFRHADHLSPNLAVVKQQLGNYMAEQGNYPAALAYYMKAIDLDPGEAVYHYGLGELLATFRDKFVADKVFTDETVDSQTLTAFAKAVELDPKNKDFAFRHAEAYYDVKSPNWEDALALWAGISERKNLSAYERDAVRLHMARINCEMGRNGAALELLRDEVTPVLQATRARLMKRISLSTTPAQDKANAEAIAPGGSDVAKDAAVIPAK